MTEENNNEKVMNNAEQGPKTPEVKGEVSAEALQDHAESTAAAADALANEVGSLELPADATDADKEAANIPVAQAHDAAAQFKLRADETVSQALLGKTPKKKNKNNGNKPDQNKKDLAAAGNNSFDALKSFTALTPEQKARADQREIIKLIKSLSESDQDLFHAAFEAKPDTEQNLAEAINLVKTIKEMSAERKNPPVEVGTATATATEVTENTTTEREGDETVKIDKEWLNKKIADAGLSENAAKALRKKLEIGDKRTGELSDEEVISIVDSFIENYKNKPKAEKQKVDEFGDKEWRKYFSQNKLNSEITKKGFENLNQFYAENNRYPTKAEAEEIITKTKAEIENKATTPAETGPATIDVAPPVPESPVTPEVAPESPTPTIETGTPETASETAPEKVEASTSTETDELNLSSLEDELNKLFEEENIPAESGPEINTEKTLEQQLDEAKEALRLAESELDSAQNDLIASTEKVKNFLNDAEIYLSEAKKNPKEKEYADLANQSIENARKAKLEIPAKKEKVKQAKEALEAAQLKVEEIEGKISAEKARVLAEIEASLGEMEKEPEPEKGLEERHHEASLDLFEAQRKLEEVSEILTLAKQTETDALREAHDALTEAKNSDSSYALERAKNLRSIYEQAKENRIRAEKILAEAKAERDAANQKFEQVDQEVKQIEAEKDAEAEKARNISELEREKEEQEDQEKESREFFTERGGFTLFGDNKVNEVSENILNPESDYSGFFSRMITRLRNWDNRATYNKLEQKAAAMESQLSSLQSNINSREKAIENLRNKLANPATGRPKERIGWQKELEKLNRQLQPLIDKFDKLNEKYQDLQSSKEELHVGITERSERVASSIEEKISPFLEKITEGNIILQQLAYEIKDHQTRQEQRTQDLNDLKQKYIRAPKADRAAIKALITEIEGELKDYKASIKEANNKYNTCSHRINALNRRIGKQKNIMNSFARVADTPASFGMNFSLNKNPMDRLPSSNGRTLESRGLPNIESTGEETEYQSDNTEIAVGNYLKKWNERNPRLTLGQAEFESLIGKKSNEKLKLKEIEDAVQQKFVNDGYSRSTIQTAQKTLRYLRTI